MLFVSALPCFGVVDQALEVQGTNLVLSWPSGGNESYLIQYRPSLDPGTPWVQLTNCYHANSTNRTTFIVPCCALTALGGGGSAMRAKSGSGVSSALKSFDSANISAALEVASEKAYPTSAKEALAAGLTSYYTAPPPMPPVRVKKNGMWITVPYEEIYGRLMPTEVKIPLRTQERFLKSLADGNKSDESELNNQLRIRNGGCDCPDLGFFRVWHIPDFPAGITNYTFDGPIFIPVDFKDYLERVDNIGVLLDGKLISDTVFTSLFYNNQTNWGMGIYFDLFPSGTHQIQLVTTLRLNDVVGDGSVSLVLSNLTRTITVDNQVMFTNWDGLILSSNFTYTAQTKNPDTDWYVDLYDASFNYVNGGSGHTYNGQISWTWDLTDTGGNPRDDLDGDPYFYAYVTFNTAAGAQITRRGPAPQTEYPSVGYWLITYSDRHILDAGPLYAGGDQYYTNGVIAIAGGPSFRGIPNTLFPIKFGTNYTQQERNDSWSYVKASLFDARYRNFYYHGHGGPNVIGADVHTFTTNGTVDGGITLSGSKAYLTSQSVSNELTFNRYSGARPYRFVWLDGCSTANGNWPGAFGVDKASYDLDHYTNSASNPKHRRPSAFVGWNQIVGGPQWGSSLAAANFRSEWMSKWYYNWQTEGLTQAFKDASQSANWPPGGESRLFGAMKIYGYSELLMNGYNQKNDWRWP